MGEKERNIHESHSLNGHRVTKRHLHSFMKGKQPSFYRSDWNNAVIHSGGLFLLGSSPFQAGENLERKADPPTALEAHLWVRCWFRLALLSCYWFGTLTIYRALCGLPGALRTSPCIATTTAFIQLSSPLAG